MSPRHADAPGRLDDGGGSHSFTAMHIMPPDDDINAAGAPCRCRMCSHRLTAPASVARGVGPVCRQRPEVAA